MPSTKFNVEDTNKYHSGLNSYFESEAIRGSLPKTHSHPQRHSHGLYTERLSGTSFTAKRAVNKQSFLYRIYPTSAQSTWEEIGEHALNQTPFGKLRFLPNQYIWRPFEIEKECNFIDGVRLIGGAGEPALKNGVAYYSYTCGKDMDPKQAFYSADGDWLIVPQLGVLDVQTEMGMMRVRPCEICVIPRGIRFRVTLPKGPSRGHFVETFSGHFDVPELGTIGSIGLANVRDFEIPTARYIDSDDVSEVLAKFGGRMHKSKVKGGNFNVVSWHGTYYPFKYDLGKFMPMGSTLYDYQDPSISTVLTCPSDKPDHAAVDFVVMGQRWLAMDAFRLPSFHRNIMSEFSAVIKGGYDQSKVPEFMYGMSSLHNSFSPHGMSAGDVEKEMNRVPGTEKISEDQVAFMFESCFQIGLSEWALKTAIPSNGGQSFGNFKRNFKANI